MYRFGGATSRCAITGLLPLAVSMFVSVAAYAEPVSLRSADGTIELTGELVGFNDGNYVIATDLGELTISSRRVRCVGEACPEIGTDEIEIRMTGSDTIATGLMPLLASGYATFVDAEVDITNTPLAGQFLAKFVADQGFGDPMGDYLVTATASADAFEALLDQSTEVGMSSRRITPDEARALRDNGAGSMIAPSQEHIVAVDSLVVVVNRENPLTSISISDLSKIYSGEVNNWSQLGGPDRPIIAVHLDEESGARSVFEERLFGASGGPEPKYLTIAADNNRAAALINGDTSAIGYVGSAFQRGAKALRIRNECQIETAADLFSIKAEEYTIQRRMYLYNRADTTPELIKDFLSFATSPAADQVIAQSGFVDFSIVTSPQDEASPRWTNLRNMIADRFLLDIAEELKAAMAGTERLSTTFRFRTGSNKLDDRGERDLVRLIDYLEGLPVGTIVTLAGFTDDVGEFEPNRVISLDRAQAVADHLRDVAGGRLSGLEIRTLGFGELAPVACNDSNAGRQTNRRVEVWISSNAG